ncbi:hypothetical protein [Microvirga soli]|uniref:hypothetical protein n=1 Tax=Microvirga soli TaxID=1854496 RepID=UPI00191DD60D|nr:hypothetical protein [Microvirga soli]
MHDFIVALDIVDAGFLGWLIRLSEHRRQIVFAVLSRVGANIPRTICQSQEVSEQLLALRPVLADIRQLRSSDLLAKYFGSCPDGFHGAVAKTVSGPQPRLYYETLHTTLSDPEHRQIAKVVRLLPSCDWTRLRILLALHPQFLHPRFAAKVSSVQQAADLATALTLIRQVVGDEASDEALTNSIRSIAENVTVPMWVSNWLSRAKHVAYPQLELGPDWIGLDSGRKLVEAGRRLRVCLGHTDRILDVLRGRNLYYEDLRQSVVAEVQAVGPQRFLVLMGVYGRGNSPIPRGLRREVEAEFLSAGVPSLKWWSEDCPWRAIERIPNAFFDLGLDDELDLQGLQEEAA